MVSIFLSQNMGQLLFGKSRLRLSKGGIRRNSIRHLPVVEDGYFVGFVTEGDLRQASLLSMVDKVSIEDVMIKNPVTISPEASLEEAAKLIFAHKIGGLPVVRGKKLVGEDQFRSEEHTSELQS